MLIKKIEKIVKRNLSKHQISSLIHFISTNKIMGLFIGLLFGRNLTSLAIIYKTDKYGDHNYPQHYQKHFKKFKFKSIKLLEIGVGGYESPYEGGNSLRMWKRYFPFGKIFSIDIYDKSPQEQNRIKIFMGSQVDVDFLNNVTQQTGDFDLIIDDGSHQNNHVIETFKILFPKLKDGGIYVIEDTQTSYWEGFGGDSIDLNNNKTTMNYFKSLTDSLNSQEFVRMNYQPSYYDKKIISMHFYHNLIFIYKGDNDEKSNALVNNQWPSKSA